MKIHITKQGETLDEITKKYNLSQQDLMGINPHIDFNASLVSGLKLKIPETREVGPTSNMENFYPRLDHEQQLKEQAVPIGLKPFPEVNASHETPEMNPQHPASDHPIYGHLNESSTYLNTAPPHLSPPWNPYFPSVGNQDMRLPYPPYYPPYPPYPYPYPYPYPAYGYGLPLPFPGFGFGHGFGHGGHGWHGGHGGHHR